MSPITSHILDTRLGRPAAGVCVTLERRDAHGSWQFLCRALSNDDGRVPCLLSEGAINPGRHRLTFDVGGYFHAQKVEHFYPQVTIEFEIIRADEHYHVPLLLSPFGYSTYRGS
jgi:5-hydroxyisourate hydrolase